MPELQQVRFIGEQVTVHFHRPPVLEKKPGPPDVFTWEGRTYRVQAVLKEWHNYRRRGAMAHNMKPAHAATASRRGSWGVGRDYYRVETENGRFFDLYYDRAPKDVDRRKGGWFLHQELAHPDEAAS